MQPEQQLIVFNGQGGEYLCTIDKSSKKHVEIAVEQYKDNDSESPLKIHLAQGISRGDKMEFTIQKAVELGVHAITPLFTERCGVKLAEDRLQKKINQWQHIAISACEQSGRCSIPEIKSPQTLEQWLSQETDDLKLNLFPHANASIKTITPPTHGVRFIIGPEGGLSDEEINQTRDAGYQDILLGPRVLRTETAALAVITALQVQFGDLV